MTGTNELVLMVRASEGGFARVAEWTAATIPRQDEIVFAHSPFYVAPQGYRVRFVYHTSERARVVLFVERTEIFQDILNALAR